MKPERCIHKATMQPGADVRSVSVLAAAMLCVLVGCQPARQQTASLAARTQLPNPSEEGAYFVDATRYMGIDFVHTIGDGELSNIVETVGSGAAFLDFDQDGYLDLFVANAAYLDGVSEGEKPKGVFADRLYRNREGVAFEDVTEKSGIAGEKDYSMGVAAADYDNDGFPDLYVCNYGANVLYHNNGDGTFTDVTAKSGVAGNANTVGAVWLDYDNDGLLDLYVGNYLQYDPEYKFYYAPDGFPPPMAYPGEPDVLYRNNGDGTFTDVTEAVGLYHPEGRMMGVGAADYDDDGYMDIYVANDAMANALYHNEGGKQFTDVGFGAGVAFSVGGEETSSMAVDFADYNSDGLLDFFVSDIHFSALYRNEGSGLFSDVTAQAGIAVPSGQYDGWGAAFIDYDNDGDVDLFKVNGAMNHLYGHEDQLLENQGDGTFQDVSLERGSYFKQEKVGRGAAFGDFDNDGDLDVFIVNMNDQAVLLRNEGLDGNNWIKIHLTGTISNRDGVGARVKVTANGKTQLASKASSSGYLSTDDPALHFGLGKAQIADRIEVKWPSGVVQVLEGVSANQMVAITEQAADEALHASLKR